MPNSKLTKKIQCDGLAAAQAIEAQKLTALRKAHAVEAAAAVKFQLAEGIKSCEQRIDEIQKDMDALNCEAEETPAQVKSPKALATLVRTGKTVLWVGPDLPAAAFGHPPSLQSVKEELSASCRFPGNPESYCLSDLAQYYESVLGRPALERAIRDHFLRPGLVAHDFTRLISDIPFGAIILGCYDRTVESALSSRSGKGTAVIDLNDFLADSQHQGIIVIRLLGSPESPARASTLIITANDLATQWDNQVGGIQQLRNFLVEKTWIFVGWDPNPNTLFNKLHSQVLRDFTAISGVHHLVWHDCMPEVIASLYPKLEVHCEEPEPFLARLSQLTIVSTGAPIAPKRLMKGPEPFTTDEWEMFFGREVERQSWLLTIGGQRLTVMAGPSGIGKTSFIRAGLIHSLEEQFKADHTGMAVYVQCREDPVRATQDAILQKLRGGGLKKLSPDLPFGTFLNHVLNQIEPQRLFLFIDQFEAFFLQTGRSAGPALYRTHFLQPLKEALANHPNLHVVFSLRSEYLERLWQLNDLKFSQATGWLQGLSVEAASEVVKRTIEACKIQVTPGVGEQVSIALARLPENRVDPSALSIILKVLHDHCAESKNLTLDTLADLGGVETILANYLEGVLTKIEIELKPKGRQPSNSTSPSTPRQTAQAILIALSTHLETSNPLKWEELLNRIGISGHTEELRARRVLEKLKNHRVVRSSSEGGYPVFELAHESLVKGMSFRDERTRTEQAIFDILEGGVKDYDKRQCAFREEDWDRLNEYFSSEDRVSSWKMLPKHWEVLVFSAIRWERRADFWISCATEAASDRIEPAILKHGIRARAAMISLLDSQEFNAAICERLLDILIRLHVTSPPDLNSARQLYDFALRADFTHTAPPGSLRREPDIVVQ